MTAPAGARTIARSAASAGTATMASRILGLVRDQVLASLFGASPVMDAYVVAFRVPNLLRDLFAEGAMSAAFVPTFTRHLTTEGKASAWRLGNHVVNALVLVTGALVLLGMIFTGPLVGLLTAQDFAQTPGQVELTVTLARIMLPSLVFIALAAACMGMLNSLQHFFIPALSPAMFNVVTILMALLVVPFAGTLGVAPIAIIAAATLLGGVAQLGLQAPTLWKEGFRWRPVLDWRDEGLRRVMILMGPGTIGLAATQFNLVVNQILATRELGAASWLNYAFRIMYLPIGLFGVSIATAVLPAVARHSAQRNVDGIRSSLSDGLSLMLMLNVPATVGLVVLAEPIVRVIFERGVFTAADTAATAAALQFYALGLASYSVVRITSPTFYALGRNRVPVMVSMATVAVNASLNIVLVETLGYRGLALGTSVAALFNATTLFLLLRAHLHGINGGRLLSSVTRIAGAALAMGVAAHESRRLLEQLVPGDAAAVQIARLAATIGVALLVLAVSAWALRIREFNDSMALVTRRLRRPRQ